MKIPYHKKFCLIEKEDYANYLFVVINWEGMTNMPRELDFKPIRYAGAEYINSACNLFCLDDSYNEATRHSFQLLFNDPRAWDDLHKVNKRSSDQLLALSHRIKKLKANKLNDKELIKWIDLAQAGQASVHVPRLVMWLLETPENIITNYLHNYLDEIYKEIKKINTPPQEALRVLTTPTRESNWMKEKKELSKIARIRNISKRQELLKRHTKKYEWLEYGLQGKILALADFEDALQKIKHENYERKLERETEDLIRQQQEVERQYKIGKTHKKIFQIVRDSLFVRLYSKDAQFFSYYAMENIFREFGKRTGLTLEQVRFLAPGDFCKVLMGSKKFGTIAKERQAYSLTISDEGKTKYWTGNAAKKIMKKIKVARGENVTVLEENLKGQTAYGGKAKGRVKIINTMAEMAKMHSGNILVSRMTNPSIVPAMKKAVAIITDMGGITCHAAIVARELAVPCIIGTKVATQVLRDGDLVEVDADKGVVRKIK